MRRFIKPLCLILSVCFSLTSVFSVYADEDPALSSDTSSGSYSSSEASTVEEPSYTSDGSTTSEPVYTSSAGSVSSPETVSSYITGDSSSFETENNYSESKKFAPTEPIPSFSWTEEMETALNAACSYLMLNQKSSEYLLVSGISGISSDITTATRILNDIEQKQGNYDSVLALSRDILTLTFSSFNPEDFRGINLIQELANTDLLEGGGIYKQAIALIAFDSGSFSVPENSTNSRRAIISRILKCQTEDGSFCDSEGSRSAITATAVAITALSPYQQETEITDAIQKALSYLQQTGSAENCTELAWTITALSSLSLTPTDTRFTHGSSNLVNDLLEYAQPDGSFSQKGNVSDFDFTVTEIAVIALTAAKQQTNPFILQNGISYDSQADSHKAFQVTVTAVGCILLLVAIGGCIYIFVRRKKQHNSKQE